MKRASTETINEVDFCGKMATAATAFFATIREHCPFVEVRLEGKGSTKSKNARKDLRFYGPNNQILLTGEVKLPGKGLAIDSNVVKDANDKAEHANVQYFFTWDVNTFILWDRSQWQKLPLERRLKTWQLRLNLESAEDLARPETLEHIERRFLPDLLRDLCDIVSGHRRDWSIPPDEIFLEYIEKRLEWPVGLLRRHLYQTADTEKSFDSLLQEWMVKNDIQFRRNQPEDWRKAVDSAARSLAYIWTNRFIFYKALRARFPELPKLELAPAIKTVKQALRRFDEIFRRAADTSGDYESLLFPDAHDWANDLVFAPQGSVDAWRGFLRGIESIDFREVSTDIVGLIFQKLVSPETRHRYGQHFTGPDPVDLINSFCIRSPSDVVLDPACGSGSFLVRAYYRKRSMDERRSHVAMLSDLFGCDIAIYPAHLATLNLAAREINDEAKYPRIDRQDFFDVKADFPFCTVPDHRSGKKIPVLLPSLDAIVGNPPYVRQEKIHKLHKAKYASVIRGAFNGTELSGRSDLHCYFWPHAARFLKENGYFGFLTSAQWLDVDYGFDLQRWILKNFKIVAIMESSTERWFSDARVKTCITILQRCSDETERNRNPVRFVRFEKPLAELIGAPASAGVGPEAEEQERIRQTAVDRLRDAIERTTRKVHDDRWRVLVKSQSSLWEEGVRAGLILKDLPTASASDDEDEEEKDDDEEYMTASASSVHGDYAAGKWGRYLRAPDLYFEVMERFGRRIQPLGQIVEISRGITSGCDDFFMPTDCTELMLTQCKEEIEFKKETGVSRSSVLTGDVRLIRDGAGTVHPIEPQYVAQIIHTLRDKQRPIVKPDELDRVVLLVSEPLSKLKGKHVYRYLRHGELTTYPSKKSKPGSCGSAFVLCGAQPMV